LIIKKAKKTKVQASQAFPWHVLLFAIYPILALLAHNISQVAPASALLPLGFSVVGAGLLLLLLRLWLHDWQRAALATTILLVLFFSYGHVYSYLKGVTVSGIYLFRHRTMAPLWIVLAGLGVWWARRRKPDVRGLTRLLNVVGVVLLIFPVIQVGSGLWKQWRAWERSSPTAPNPVVGAGGGAADQTSPDIYYIILDGYGRADILQELYGYDNSEFLSSLENMGFYVANCSMSNYSQTELSLASSLNYNYLSALGNSFVPENWDRSQLWPLIKNSAVRIYLESRGYKTIAFKTGFSWTELTDADLFLAPQLSKRQLDGFQYMWLQTTFVRILLDAEALSMLKNPDDQSRQRTKFVLEQLQEIPSIDGPKFVFAHLVIPHQPFVFGPNGEAISIASDATADMSAQAYVDQVIFINKQMEIILAKIIADSPTPPIIIIQGDHGPSGWGMINRMLNLGAYYFPGHEDMLYPTITNVNAFRIVFDEYFGQDLPLLPDISLFPDNSHDFKQVENDCSQ